MSKAKAIKENKKKDMDLKRHWEMVAYYHYYYYYTT